MRRETDRHSLARSRWWLILGVTLLLLAVPATAIADNPAKSQYVLPSPSATGGSGGNHGNNQLDPSVATGGSGSDGATVAILAGGLAAIAAAAGIVIYRRRKHSGESG